MDKPNAPSAPAGPAALPDDPLNNGASSLPADNTVPSETPLASPPPSNDALISIKEQALTNLSPLVNHLDQSPDERFKTLMMLIQASDNSDLIKQAYEAANKISDEKTRAQALLDIINEINYFTQHPDAKK